MKDNKESWLSNFILNYKTNKSFKAFVKLTAYFLFIFILMFLMIIFNVKEPNKYDEDNKTTTTNVVENTKKTVRDLIEDLYKTKKNFAITVKNSEKEYLIEITNNLEDLTGTISSDSKTSRFKIKDNKIYELVMKDEILNENLLAHFELKYIIPESLAEILLKNKIIKHESNEEIVLSYDLKEEQIKVSIKNNEINNIHITKDKNEYLIEIR